MGLKHKKKGKIISYFILSNLSSKINHSIASPAIPINNTPNANHIFIMFIIVFYIYIFLVKKE